MLFALSLYTRVLLRKTRVYRERELIFYTVKDECARVRRISDRAAKRSFAICRLMLELSTELSDLLALHNTQSMQSKKNNFKLELILFELLLVRVHFLEAAYLATLFFGYYIKT